MPCALSQEVAVENLLAAPAIIAIVAGVVTLAKVIVSRTQSQVWREVVRALLVRWWVRQLRRAGASDKDVRRFVEKYALAGPGGP